ncbi:MAG: PfkB family carbohydrate kinase [Treponema sp.]|nr:PfkB family carbohydrate kinase [Treponema sp.]
MSFLTICLNPTIQKTLRFNSLTPGDVNRASSHRVDVSGKGINVTRVLTQLGKKAVHLTHLGGVMRPLFLSLCEQDGLCVEWVESGSQIRFCYTVINDDNSDVTELIEESEPVAAETEKLLLEKFDTLLSSHSAHQIPDCIIISGTKAAGFSDDVIPYMVRKTKEKGLRIILDIKGNDLIECLKYEPDVIKPNLEEFLQTFKLDPDNQRVEADLNGLITDITQKYKCRVILTNGGGKLIAADPQKIYEIDVPSTKAVNTTGCGDAFTAGLAAALDDCWAASQPVNFTAAINEGMRCGALNAALIRPGVIK